MKMPHTPFATRLSGSAKETELRLRSIFQWKKKRPPVIVLVAAVLIIVFCGSLIGFGSTPRNGTLAEVYQEFFAENPTNQIKYVNKDAMGYPMLVPEDEAFHAALEYMSSMNLRSVIGGKKYIGDFDYRHGAISLSSATGQGLEIDLYPTVGYVVIGEGADAMEDPQVYQWDESFDVEVFLSYLASGLREEESQTAPSVTPVQPEPAPTNGAPEQETLPSDNVNDPSLVLAVMERVKGSDFINPEYFGNVTAEQLAAALNAAVNHQISEAEFVDAIGGAYGSVFPHWYIENAWLEGGPNVFSSLDRHLSVNCGLPENIVEVTLREDNRRNTAYFKDEALYQLVRHKDDYEETIDSQSYEQFKDLLLPKMESALSLMENNPGNFTGYELTRFTPVWRYEDPATGNSVVLYDFFFGLLTDTPETVGWAGGMAFDSKLRLVGLNVPVQFAVQYRGNEIRAAFMAPEFYYDPADTDSADWAVEQINRALNQAGIYDSGDNAPEEQSKTGLYSTYKDVLLSNSEFSHNGVLEDMEAYTADTASAKRTAKYFTVLDLDGDHREEVVVWVEINSTNEFLILREHDGTVFGYSKVQRALMDLKTDGTFSWSGGAYHHGTASLSFSDVEAIEHEITYCDIDSWTNEGIFVVNGAEATNVEFNDAISAQSAKPDVIWHEFTEERISAHFMD